MPHFLQNRNWHPSARPDVVAYVILTFLASLKINASEEFVGPFPSWRDLKRDYGAAGDGRVDDTKALQRALDDLIRHEAACVLYVPVGTYRLTRTVQTVRKAHTDCQGVSVLGEDPARTVLRWDGVEGETMLRWDAWYSRIGRLTFDGAGRAGTALLYGPAFSTYNETSDIIFRDVKAGLVFGGPGTNGQAENEVLRCQFLGCDTGVQTVNWNSMDIWVWYCRFVDCGRSIYNVMGNWHAWRNVFIWSRISDLAAVNLMAFSVVQNTSLGSRCFFDFDSGHTWGSPVSLTGNRILDPTGDWAVRLGNAGPYLVVDNAFRLRGETRGVRMTWADQTLVGNVYTREAAVEERGRFRRIAERVVRHDEISSALPALPPTPPHRQREIIEVPAGSGEDAIQQAINRAASLSGQRPVVHLPMGTYKVSRTIVIPSRSDVQLIGDGGAETATRLEWSGPAGGVVLRLEGPGRATLSDFYIHAPNARGLLIEDADQEGGRIFADQLNVNGATDQKHGRTAALRVIGLEKTDVLLRALQGSGHGGAWIDVAGGPSGLEAKNQISVFTGATGSAAGQYDVRDGGRLVVRGVYHERSSATLTGLRLADTGELSIDATRFSYATSSTSPTITAIDFRGHFTLATCMLMPVETRETCRFELRGDGSQASVLALNNQFWVHKPGTFADTVWVNRTIPRARGGLIGCNINTSNKEAAPKGFEFLENVGDHPDPARSRFGSGPLADHSGVDDATILRHLSALREARVWLPGDRPTPGGATDVRLHRIMVSGGRDGAVEFRAAIPANAEKKRKREWVPISDKLVADLTAEGKEPAWPGKSTSIVADRTTGNVILAIPGRGLWSTEDNGATFHRIDKEKVSGRAETGWALNMDLENGKRMYCFMLDGLSAMSPDGKEWRGLAGMGRGWDYGAVDWSSKDPKKIFAMRHEAGGEHYISGDGASSWTLIGKDKEVCSVGVIGPDVLIKGRSDGLHRSTDEGRTWEKVAGVRPQGRTVTVFKKAAYITTARGLLVSKDKGKTWAVQGSAVNAWHGPYFGADEKHMVIVGANGFQESKDAGKTWKIEAPLAPGMAREIEWFACFAWDPVNEVFYAARMGQPAYKYER